MYVLLYINVHTTSPLAIVIANHISAPPGFPHPAALGIRIVRLPIDWHAGQNNKGLARANAATNGAKQSRQPQPGRGLVGIHQMAPLEHTSDRQAYYSFIDPGRMKGWVGLPLVGTPMISPVNRHSLYRPNYRRSPFRFPTFITFVRCQQSTTSRHLNVHRLIIITTRITVEMLVGRPTWWPPPSRWWFWRVGENYGPVLAVNGPKFIIYLEQ